MPKCKYEYKPGEFEFIPPEVPLDCKEQTTSEKSEFCIFHDEYNFVGHEQEASKRFEEKVKESINQNEPLLCFGYYLPAISFAELLEEESFERAVYFNGATFSKRADFSRATFSDEVRFRSATFSEVADFFRATFSKRADFFNATFSKRADFFRATFSKRADFFRATFSKRAEFSRATFSDEVSFHSATFSEGADFSRATFSDEVKFSSATFSEGADFFATTFTKGANFGSATFSKGAIFYRVTFSEAAVFYETTFSEGADFMLAKFLGEAYFLNTKFIDRTFFRFTIFEQPNRAVFEKCKLSNVSFANCDITRIRFGDKVTWREGKNRFTIIEEELLESEMSRKNEEEGEVSLDELGLLESETNRKNKEDGYESDTGALDELESEMSRKLEEEGYVYDTGALDELESETEAGEVSLDELGLLESETNRKNKEDGYESDTENEFDDAVGSLELVLSVYRNLRENYEFRLRYDDAGKLFIKEMELKRKYREVPSISDFKLKLLKLRKKLKGDKSPLPKVKYHLEKNGPLRRNFSLTGLYYHFSYYGESISRPTLIGAITVILSTLFWLTQSNPVLEPHFPPTVETDSTSTFVGFRDFYNGTYLNGTHLLKSFERSFADFLPLLPAGDFKVGIIDFIIKIVGGALTFGLLLIAFRRKFERKYTR